MAAQQAGPARCCLQQAGSRRPQRSRPQTADTAPDRRLHGHNSMCVRAERQARANMCVQAAGTLTLLRRDRHTPACRGNHPVHGVGPSSGQLGGEVGQHGSLFACSGSRSPRDGPVSYVSMKTMRTIADLGVRRGGHGRTVALAALHDGPEGKLRGLLRPHGPETQQVSGGALQPTLAGPAARALAHTPAHARRLPRGHHNRSAASRGEGAGGLRPACTTAYQSRRRLRHPCCAT